MIEQKSEISIQEKERVHKNNLSSLVSMRTASLEEGAIFKWFKSLSA